MTKEQKKLSSTKKKLSNVYLMAEDNPADAELVKEMLEQAFLGEYSVVCVDRFCKIKNALDKGTFEALILDMNLPDRSGIENVMLLGKKYPDLPIVVLTGQDDLALAVESLKRGAQDYLSKKHVTPEVLSRSLRYAQERKNIELKLRQALNDSADRNQQLEKMARYDFLTSLPNRSHFDSVANRTLHSALRVNKLVALLYFDINNFKKVNDSYGHAAGDSLLREVAKRLQQTVRETDFVARLGGDEFVLITDLLDEKKEVYKLVNRLLEAFEVPIDIEVHQMQCNISIGVAFFPDAKTLELLMKQADCAMYEAKEKRHVPVCFYTKQMESIYKRNIEIESQIGLAMLNKEFDVCFQRIISASRSDAFIVEGLLRWHSKALGQINPDEFIPILENTPIINQLTYIVLERSKKLMCLLEELSQQVERVKINVTISQIVSQPFCKQFLGWLEELNISPNLICLELTEREMVKNATLCRAQIDSLRQHGVQFALDDFGTGYSSITHLLEVPIDYLKLDRILIARIDENERNQALVAGIIEMAHRLNMEVIAEGIECQKELDVIKQLGCDYYQGFLMAKPMPIDELVCLYLREIYDGVNKP
ncbi:EAL domain-containing protein [Aliikangiella sp. IMCC44359]|uniref:EAL domain-containing protein n=1 Tax=Aliikangiella sp. IMCC44359 TaxID=3459125 RepID=UPI00403A8203